MHINNSSPSRSHQPEPQLPSLSTTPSVQPGCCLALSDPLIAHLCTLLPSPSALVLSIGSGYGLLEAILLHPPYNINIVGVEVHPSPNTYLPSENHHEVAGSRFLEPLAKEAQVWMFVYPRRVGLVEEYLREYGTKDTGSVEVMIWIGPTSDWEDYKGCFRNWEVETRSADEVGGRSWEIISVARRKKGT